MSTGNDAQAWTGNKPNNVNKRMHSQKTNFVLENLFHSQDQGKKYQPEFVSTVKNDFRETM